ncbi:hypothetical protein STEG23_013862 [Scotinomys teguina]
MEPEVFSGPEESLPPASLSCLVPNIFTYEKEKSVVIRRDAPSIPTSSKREKEHPGEDLAHCGYNKSLTRFEMAVIFKCFKDLQNMAFKRNLEYVFLTLDSESNNVHDGLWTWQFQKATKKQFQRLPASENNIQKLSETETQGIDAMQVADA